MKLKSLLRGGVARGVPTVTKHEKTYGSRKNPRPMLTPEAATSFCRESRTPIWVRLPLYDGVFHIYPGGRKEFYPDREKK